MIDCPSRLPYSYWIYGVRVNSDCRFDFAACRGRQQPLATVDVAQNTALKAPDETAEQTDRTWFVCRSLDDGSTYVRWSGLFEFNVAADGSRVLYRAMARGDRLVLQNFLFGQMLSFALVRQRLEPLHAAVVDVNGAAIGFLGDCTFGKSTLAAAFVEAGHRLVTDDMLVIDFRLDRPHALPGSGRIKLDPIVASALLPWSGEGVPLHSTSTKRSFAVETSSVRRTPRRLTHLFVLAPPDEQRAAVRTDIVPLSPASVFQHIVRNSFNIELVDSARLARQFAFAAELAATTRGGWLRFPRGLHELSTVRRSIVDFVTRSGFTHARSIHDRLDRRPSVHTCA